MLLASLMIEAVWLVIGIHACLRGSGAETRLGVCLRMSMSSLGTADEVINVEGVRTRLGGVLLIMRRDLNRPWLCYN